MDKQKLLIIGASSLLGKSFCKMFASEYEIITVGRTPLNNIKNIRMDLSLPVDISLLPKKIDIVLYLAQSNNFRKFPEFSEEIMDINCARVLSFLNYSRSIGIKKFLYTSTGTFYDFSKETKEEQKFNLDQMNSFYGASKACGEMMVNSFCDFFTIQIVRPFFIFGKGQRKDMLISHIINCIQNDEVITLQGSEGIKLNPIYVKDAALAIKNLLLMPSSMTVNIAGNKILSLKDISELIGDVLNKKPIFKYVSEESVNYVGDTTEMRKVMSLEFTNFRDALKEIMK